MSKSCKKFVKNLLKIRNKNGGRDILDFYLFALLLFSFFLLLLPLALNSITRPAPLSQILLDDFARDVLKPPLETIFSRLA